MAGKPSKRKPGRPSGSFDGTRDYRAAIAKMLALIADGKKNRAAARIVAEDTGIPLSTLRRHLSRKLKDRSGGLDLDDLMDGCFEVRKAPSREELEEQSAKARRNTEPPKKLKPAPFDPLWPYYPQIPPRRPKKPR